MTGSGEEGGIAVTAEAVPGSGGPRSAGTRRAILEAARSAFAAHGYDQTTIRGVAAVAGVDASMVMRYFGSKAGLFAAASIADLQIPDLSVVPLPRRGEALTRHFVERWEDAARREELMLLMRTAVTSDAVATQLQSVLAELVIAPVAALGVSDARARGGFIAAQFLGLALCRYILRQEPLASLSPAQVVTVIAPSVQHYLTAAVLADVS